MRASSRFTGRSVRGPTPYVQCRWRVINDAKFNMTLRLRYGTREDEYEYTVKATAIGRVLTRE